MTKVKICGITNLEDALAAVEFGADALGFNFCESSPRFITPAVAHDIIEKLPPGTITVGVFVNSSLDDIERVYAECSVQYIQLHGDESPEFVERLRSGTSAGIIKALRVSSDFEIAKAMTYAADVLLLDTWSRESYGGTGEKFDWTVALEIKKYVPEFYLAGGLTPENVGDAIREVTPFAVDVCSGVESTKGKKDPNKLAAFIRNARSAL